MNRTTSFLAIMTFGLGISSATIGADPQRELKTHEIEKGARSAIYLTLMPKKQGTGFLVSKSPPLVVTAAHDVANYQGQREVWMHQNETGNKSQVKAVHIHPDYKADVTEKFSADVALLELELYKHDLGQPLRLKKPEESRDLRSQEIVIVGFPFYTASTTEEKKSAEAVVREGIVSRLCDYDFHATSSPIPERPMIQLSVNTFDGDSGNPVIDRFGEVVGVVHGRRTLNFRDENKVIIERQHFPVAIHIREVWKLLELKYPDVAKKLKQ